jgi:hypothetical protein
MVPHALDLEENSRSKSSSTLSLPADRLSEADQRDVRHHLCCRRRQKHRVHRHTARPRFRPEINWQLKVAPLVTVDDPLWHHTLKWCLLDMGVLLLLGVVAAIVVWRRLRLRTQDVRPGDRARSGAANAVGIIVVIVLVAAFVAGLSVLTRGGKTRDTAVNSPLAGVPTQGEAPPQ